jgi:hypothetical protein
MNFLTSVQKCLSKLQKFLDKNTCKIFRPCKLTSGSLRAVDHQLEVVVHELDSLYASVLGAPFLVELRGAHVHQRQTYSHQVPSGAEPCVALVMKPGNFVGNIVVQSQVVDVGVEGRLQPQRVASLQPIVCLAELVHVWSWQVGAYKI